MRASGDGFMRAERLSRGAEGAEVRRPGGRNVSGEEAEVRGVMFISQLYCLLSNDAAECRVILSIDLVGVGAVQEGCPKSIIPVCQGEFQYAGN